MIMSGVLLVLLLASLDQTIVGTAMPRVIAQLHGFEQYAWVATAYLLTSTAGMPIYGKLSDLVGRKRIFLTGILVFLLGSALCGAAQTMMQLILFRGLQGIGAGALVPVAAAVIGDIFSPRERGKWQGVVGAVWGLAVLIGPTLGGWITDTFSWRWIFYVNLPVGLAALVVLSINMPSVRRSGAARNVDVLGAVLLVAGIVPLVLALTWAGHVYPWRSAPIVALFSGAVLVLVAFVLHELRSPEPILQPRLFRNRVFTVCVLATVLISAGLFGTLYFAPLFIQGVIGASATRSGAVLTPMMLMAVLGSILSGQLLSRWGRYRVLALSGRVLTVAGMAMLLSLGVHARVADALPALLVLGAGFGLGMALYNVAVQNAFPQALLGEVTSALAFFRSIGGTVGIAAMGSLMTVRYTAALHARLSARVLEQPSLAQLRTLYDPQLLLQPAARAALAHAFVLFGTTRSRLYAAVLDAIRTALAVALHDVFLGGLLIALASLFVVLFLPEIPLRGRVAREPSPEQGATSSVKVTA
jgi:EmrB/QacA subfamily drug resistance transporter